MKTLLLFIGLIIIFFLLYSCCQLLKLMVCKITGYQMNVSDWYLLYIAHVIYKMIALCRCAFKTWSTKRYICLSIGRPRRSCYCRVEIKCERAWECHWDAFMTSMWLLWFHSSHASPCVCVLCLFVVYFFVHSFIHWFCIVFVCGILVYTFSDFVLCLWCTCVYTVCLYVMLCLFEWDFYPHLLASLGWKVSSWALIPEWRTRLFLLVEVNICNHSVIRHHSLNTTNILSTTTL